MSQMNIDLNIKVGNLKTYNIKKTRRKKGKQSSISAVLYDWEMDLSQGKKNNPSLQFS